MELHIQAAIGGYILLVETPIEGGVRGELYVFTSSEEVVQFGVDLLDAATNKHRGEGGTPVPIPS